METRRHFRNAGREPELRRALDRRSLNRRQRFADQKSTLLWRVPRQTELAFLVA
jgi:hypothetical protein